MFRWYLRRHQKYGIALKSREGGRVSDGPLAILALEKGVIPGNPTFVTPNPKSIDPDQPIVISEAKASQLTSTSSSSELVERPRRGRTFLYEELVSIPSASADRTLTLS